MSDEQVPSAQELGPAVEGMRRPFWNGLEGSDLLFAFGAPFMLAAAAYHVVQIARGKAALIDIATAVYVVIAVVGLICLGFLRDELRAIVLESACPRCGFRRVRNFGAPKDGDYIPASCGACIAYLRADGVTVREEASSASHAVPWFEVQTEQYMPAVQHDAQGRYHFQLPQICSVCGAAHASAHREVAIKTTDFGVVGSVAKQYVKAERMGAIKQMGAYDDSPSEQQIGFRGMRIPVCARHTQSEAPDDDAVTFEGGTLRIQSYGFYKEFLALNHIDGPVAQPTAPQSTPP